MSNILDTIINVTAEPVITVALGAVVARVKSWREDRRRQEKARARQETFSAAMKRIDEDPSFLDFLRRK